jgi:hypothetical protein
MAATDESVSTVIDRELISNLALNGRSINTLLQLTPGVNITPENQNAQGQFSANGQRSTANYFTVDGVSANFGVSPPNFNLQTGAALRSLVLAAQIV